MAVYKDTGLEKYLKVNSSTADKGLAAWIADNGTDAVRVLDAAVKRAEAQKIKASSSYGVSAEALRSSGLARSGYTEYLDRVAERDYSAAVGAAHSLAERSAAGNLRGYSDYLKSEDERNQKSYDSVYKALKSEKLTDYDAALSRAMELGVSKGVADELAKRTTEENVSSLKREVIRIVVSRRMTRVQTEEYAAALGLPEAAVRELGDYANEINEAINSETDGTYLDYIKDKAEKSK